MQYVTKENLKELRPNFVTVIRDSGTFGLISLGGTVRMMKDKVYKPIFSVPPNAHIGIYYKNDGSILEAFGYTNVDRFRVSYKNEVKKCET